MTKNRNISDLLDANGDVKSGALDNVPASNDASALTTGTLPIARIADGDVTLAKLSATGTKDATTFLRGDNTFAEAGGGKVLQVVSTTKTDTFTGTNLTSFTDITGMSVSITPSSASSKIFILYTLNYGVSATGLRAFIKLLRDATAVGVGATAGSRLSVNSYMNNSMISATTSVVSSFLDSPSTTSSVTYKLQISSEASGFNQYINRSSQDLDNSTYGRTASTITAIEIGA